MVKYIYICSAFNSAIIRKFLSYFVLKNSFYLIQNMIV